MDRKYTIDRNELDRIWKVAAFIGIGEILLGAVGVLITNSRLFGLDSVYSMLVFVGIIWYLLVIVIRYYMCSSVQE